MTEEQKEKQKNSDTAQEIVREYERLSGDRSNEESHWQEIAERMIPAHSRSFNSNGAQRTKGEKRNEFIFDSTAATALTRFASIVDSLLTPRNQTWHRIMASDPVLNKNRNVRLWFEEVNRLLFKYRYSPKANFASQNQQLYKSLGAYGTGAMFIDDLSGEPGLRYKNVHLSQVYFAENHQGMIDKALRFFPMTARQVKQKWGEKTPDLIKSRIEQNPDQEFFFIHCVKPRGDVIYGRADYRGMDWASYYVSMDAKELLSEGGYNTFPYAISRYEQSDNEIYGRSPAMDVLPAVKTLNEQKKTILKQGHRAVDPVLLVHDDGIMDGFNLTPGAQNIGAVSADGRPLVHTLPVGNIAIGKDLMDDERAVINDAFLITIFQILAETPQMTATEVLERAREKGILLAPTMGRQQSEYLGPAIERELDVLGRQGVLPPMPQELIEAQGEYRIEYDSPLSRSQRSEEAAGIMRTVEAAMNVAAQTQNPEPLDHFNWDEIVPAMADIQGVPQSWLRGKEEIAQIRQARAGQMQEQQAIQATPGAAALIKSTAMASKAKQA